MRLTDWTKLNHEPDQDILTLAVPPLPKAPIPVPGPRPAQGPPSLDTFGHKSPLELMHDAARDRRFRRFYQRIRSGLCHPGQHALLTLTSSPDSPEDIHRSWEALRKALARRGYAFTYIGVKELTHSGLKHLHLLVRAKYIPQKLISQLWKERHNASIVFIQRIRGTKFVQHYLAKYLRKGAARYWLSASWMPPGWKPTWWGLCRAVSRHRLPWPVAKQAWAGFCQLHYAIRFAVHWNPETAGTEACAQLHHLWESHHGWMMTIMVRLDEEEADFALPL